MLWKYILEKGKEKYMNTYRKEASNNFVKPNYILTLFVIAGDMRYAGNICLSVAKTHVSPSRIVYVQAGPRVSCLQVQRFTRNNSQKAKLKTRSSVSSLT